MTTVSDAECLWVSRACRINLVELIVFCSCWTFRAGHWSISKLWAKETGLETAQLNVIESSKRGQQNDKGIQTIRKKLHLFGSPQHRWPTNDVAMPICLDPSGTTWLGKKHLVICNAELFFCPDYLWQSKVCLQSLCRGHLSVSLRCSLEESWGRCHLISSSRFETLR